MMHPFELTDVSIYMYISNKVKLSFELPLAHHILILELFFLTFFQGILKVVLSGHFSDVETLSIKFVTF